MGKNHKESSKLIDKSVLYTPAETMDLVVKTSKAKFDETIELAISLGVDPRHADQQVRGAVVLPYGTGKSVKVLVFAKAGLFSARETVMVVMPTRLAMSLMVTDFFLFIGKAAKGNTRRLARAVVYGDSNQRVPALRPVTFGFDHIAQQRQRLLQHCTIACA
jgi:hypothetical protein